MHEYSGSSINTAKAAREHDQKLADDATKRDTVINTTHQLASDQVALLKESNELALKAYDVAKEARVDSERASKTAASSNKIAGASLIIAAASLIVAIASLVFTFY